jgi:hypothetical protein
MSVDPAGGDPTEPQSWNRYSYTLNNPLRYVDPDGEAAVNVQKIISLNSQIRNKLGFVPNFILDLLLPADAESLVASSLPGPQALGTGIVSKSVGKALFITPDRFEGVREVSRTLINASIAREDRIDIISSFVERKIIQRTATGNESVIRYFGGKARAKGRFVTPSFPVSGSARDVLALPPENLGTGLSQFRLRKGAIFFEGPVAPNFQRPGGGVQYFVPNLDDLVPLP